MTKAENDLLFALALMCQQYLEDDGELDHMAMSAGEYAVDELAKYGLITPCNRGGTWTQAGKALLNSQYEAFLANQQKSAD